MTQHSRVQHTDGHTVCVAVAAPVLCPSCRAAPAEPATVAGAPLGSLACRACGAVLTPEEPTRETASKPVAPAKDT